MPDRIRAPLEIPQLVQLRGAPRRLRLDNRPEFISAALRQWAQQHGVTLIHIPPGKPTQNAYIERFNRTFRTEVLDRFVFTTLEEVRRMAEDWRHRYNHQRPHRSLAACHPSASQWHNYKPPLILSDLRKRGRFTIRSKTEGSITIIC
ncbi:MULTISPECIES: integrase core domain-containing protein [Xanthomonas]|uniref:integrase core domain-containing protein n=1 Tax=Xanthomonas TaxID=338 RepID=UPI0004E61A0B